MADIRQIERRSDVIDRLKMRIASVWNDLNERKCALIDYNRHRGHLDFGVEEAISRMSDRYVAIISKVASKGDRVGKLLEYIERHYGKFEREIRVEAGKKPSVARFVRICKTISDAVQQSVRDHDQMVSYSTCLFEGYSLLCENPRESSRADGLSNDLCFTKSERQQMLAAYKRLEQTSIFACGENFSFYKSVFRAFGFASERDDAKGVKRVGEIFVGNGAQLLYDNTIFDDQRRIVQLEYRQRLRWEEVKDCLVDEMLDREYVYNLSLVTLGENADVAFRDDHLLQERSDEIQKQIPVYYCRKLILADYDAVVGIRKSIRPNTNGVYRKDKAEKLLESEYERGCIEGWLFAVGLSIEALRAYDSQQVNDVERRHVARGVVRVNLDNMSVKWTDARQQEVSIPTKSEAYFLVVVMAFLKFGEGRSPADWGDVFERIKQLNIGDESPFLWCRKDRLLCADTNKLFQRVRERFEKPMRAEFGKDLRLLPCDRRGRGTLPGPANWWEYVGVEWVRRQKVTVLFPRDGHSMIREVLKLILPSRDMS